MSNSVDMLSIENVPENTSFEVVFIDDAEFRVSAAAWAMLSSERVSVTDVSVDDGAEHPTYDDNASAAAKIIGKFFFIIISVPPLYGSIIYLADNFAILMTY